MNKKMLIIPLLLIATIAFANAAVVTYDFDSCANLTACNLSEVGYNAGLGLSYITTLGSDSVLYFNGARHTASPYEPYVLQLLDVPVNATYVNMMIRPVDNNYAEFGFAFLANNTNVLVPWTGIFFSNTDFYNRVDISYDFDGSEYTTGCSPNLVVGAWNNVTLIMNDNQKLQYYIGGVLGCEIDWSYQSYNVVNLGDIALIRTTTGDTSPNIYFDNITFSNEIGSLEQPIEEEVSPIIANGYTYDFEESCSSTNLSCYGLREVGYNKGYNQSYVTSFNGENVLYYNGLRKGTIPYYNYLLQFLYVPSNVTVINYSVYPIDNSYSEFGFITRLNNTGLQFSPASYLNAFNTDFSNYLTLSASTNTTSSTNACSQYTPGTWNNIMIVLDQENKTLKYYKDDMINADCELNLSATDLSSLGEFALLRTTTSDSPNVYLDNISFYNDNYVPITNTAPTINTISPNSPTVSMNETDNQTFTIEATDPENDTLQYSWTVDDTPVGTDSDTYVLVGTAYGEGNYEVIVSVTDGEFSENNTWTVTINNQPPVITTRSPTQTDLHIYQDGAQTFTIEATDPEGGVLFYSWELDGNPLFPEVFPTWSFIAADRGTGYFNITAYVEDENSNIVKTTWLLNVTAGYTADYDENDISPVVIDGIVKLFVIFVQLAALIGVGIIIIWSYKKVTRRNR